MKIVIAIDGPAGSGKGTLAKKLAEKFNCVPSQINYVISTRFRPSQGYYVESRRGGRRTHKNKKSKYYKK